MAFCHFSKFSLTVGRSSSSSSSWKKNMAARRPLDIIRNTHTHTYTNSWVLIYVTHTAVSPLSPLWAGLTGECLFDRRQIETCNKMIKLLLLAIPLTPPVATNYLVNFLFFFALSLSMCFSQCTPCIIIVWQAYSIFIWPARGSLTCMENHISHSYLPLS